MGATVISVRIDVQSSRARRAKAAAQDLINTLAEVPGVNVEADHDAEVPDIAVHYVFHIPKEPIAAAIIAVARRHPKVTIKAGHTMGIDVSITGEASAEQRKVLAAVLGDYGDDTD